MSTSDDPHPRTITQLPLLRVATLDQSLFSVRVVGALLMVFLVSVPSFTRADVASIEGTPQDLVEARLVAETTSLGRHGSGWLAVHLTMKPGWHTYWRNPGDAGLATSIKWTLPDGVTTGPIVWPQPERFVARSIVGYGYRTRVALLSTVKLSPRFALDRITIGADVSWLACADICTPGSETLRLTLPVTNTVAKTDPAQARLFAEMRRRIPRPAPFRATFVVDEDRIRLYFPRATFSGIAKMSAVFYPFENNLIEHAAPQPLLRHNQRFELTLQRSPVSGDQLGMLDGVLIVQESANGTVKSQAFDVFARPAKTAFKPLQAR